VGNLLLHISSFTFWAVDFFLLVFRNAHSEGEGLIAFLALEFICRHSKLLLFIDNMIEYSPKFVPYEKRMKNKSSLKTHYIIISHVIVFDIKKVYPGASLLPPR